MKVNYCIYQLKHNDAGMVRLHRTYDEVKGHIQAQYYESVWEEKNFQYEPEENAVSEFEKNGINAIIKKLSSDLPEGFYGHVPSVSDIIVLDDKSAWYVDATGYKELPVELIEELKK